MRQGPDYLMRVHRYGDELVKLPVPLELQYDFDDVESVNWRDNGDGTFTITLGISPGAL